MSAIFHRVLLAGLAAAISLPVGAQEIRPDLALLTDPLLKAPPPTPADTTRMIGLWILALKRPESELQRQAAEAIARAHKAGVTGLSKATGELLAIVAADQSHPAARYAAAQALVTLDHKEAAGELRAAAGRHGALIKQVVEPALARWDDQPIRDVWLARLSDRNTHRRELMLALAGLGTVGEPRATAACLALAKDSQQSADVRLAAARAAGSISDHGLEGDAAGLVGTPQPPQINRLCAVALLSRHRSAEAQQLLLRLAADPEPAVMAAALSRLAAIDVQLVLPLAEAAMQHADANVRQLGAAAYVQRPTPARVTALARLLDDPHPKVRGQVREDLFSLAKTPELDQTVREGAMAALAGESWRGQEQAALLLAALDHKPAAPRLVALLESNRPEVMVATAWGLRKLAVPETLPALLDKARRQTEFRKTKGELPGLDEQVAHLCEALGLMKYAPAESVLRQYIPKRQDWTLSRMAGIWAVGHLHAGKPNEELAALLIARLTDRDPINPEMPSNRMAAAISLGRMKAASQVEAMRGWMGPVIDPEPVDMAIRWALIEITGEKLPPVATPAGRLGTWFLEPLDSSDQPAR